MKRVGILVIILVLSFLICGCSRSGELEYINMDDENHSYTKLEDKDFLISNFSIDEIPYVFLEKVSRLKIYEKETIGNTIAKKVIEYNQEIHNLYISSTTEKHLTTKSTSTLANIYHEAYFKDDVVSYREKEKNEFSVISYEEYRSIYGFFPYDRLLEGFVLNEETIIEVKELEKNKYKISIDGEKAGAYIKTQMKCFGSLSDYPSFSKVEITIYVDDNIAPISITLHEEYQVSKAILGKMNCTQDYVVTYKINE